MVVAVRVEKARIAISISKSTPSQLGRLVNDRVFESRSGANQEAVEEKLRRLQRTRLAEECAKLDPASEQTMAEEGLGAESPLWPDYWRRRSNEACELTPRGACGRLGSIREYRRWIARKG